MSNQVLHACVILSFNNHVVKNYIHYHDRSSIVAMSHYLLTTFLYNGKSYCKLTLQILSTTLQKKIHLEARELFVENMTT